MKKIIFLLSVLMSHLSYASVTPLPQHSLGILIVGAGPAGLCVAKALQNSGIYPDIIEKESQIRSDGAGIAIPANGSWALKKLGVDIASKALRIPKMKFTDDQGNILIQEEIDTIHPEGAQFYSLGRDQLMQQLSSCLHPRTSIRTSVTITRFSEENDRVKVTFSDGQTKDYDFVIGCDGVHSSLRSHIHPDEVPEFLGLLVWRTIIDAPKKIEAPTYMLGPDRLALLYPMPDHKIYVYGHIVQPVKNPAPGTFSHIFSCFGAPITDIIDTIDQQFTIPGKMKFYIHHMEKSHSVRFKLDGFERVLLVGDAAHAFGPMLQNGAAQAFEDAYVLQELFNEGVTTGQIPTLIEAFAKRRTSRVEQVFAISNATIKAISDPQQIHGRNEAIRRSGAPNVNAFKLIMQHNP